MKDITFGNIIVGESNKPFIIAEMSGNHNQSLDRAIRIVELAAEAGVQAIKIQTYTPDTMTIEGAMTIDDENSLWDGQELYDLYKKAHTPWEWHKPIFKRAKELGLFAFSTPFDETAVEFLEELGVLAYKIASFENTDLPLLKKVAKTGKPVIMSTGTATVADIDEAVKVLRTNGCSEIVLLKCTSTYPASPKDSNLMTIPHMRNLFDCHTGLSDHTRGIGAAVASIALGARLIEKHFTLDREDGGVDSEFSLEPDELKSLVIESERAFNALGKIQYDVQKSEKANLKFKRSIYIVKDIEEGKPFTSDNLRIIRPGFGLKPKYYENILGKKAKQNLSKGTPLNWDLI